MRQRLYTQGEVALAMVKETVKEKMLLKKKKGNEIYFPLMKPEDNRFKYRK